MSSLYSELTNLFDQDFMSFEEGKPIFDWLNRHQEDINNIEIDYINDISNAQEKVAELEHRLSNCIEPKFKVGQEVYTIDKSRANYIGTGTITEIRLDEFGIVYKFTIFKSNYSENYNYKKEQDLFATEEDAKAKLREIQNG